MNKLSNRKSQYYNYWQKRVAEIQEEVPFLRNPSSDEIVNVTHGTGGYDQFIFWISPQGDKVLEAPKGHIESPPYDDKSILSTPGFKGWLRGRAARLPDGRQLIVVYLEPGEFLKNTYKIHQLLGGISKFPIRVEENAVVVDSSGSILGTVGDLESGQLG